MSPRPWAEIGAAVRSRRQQLGLTQLDLAARAGLSEATVRVLETARRQSYRAANLRAIAVALEWPEDAFSRLAAGLPAEGPSPERPTAGTIDDRVAALEAEVVRLRDELAARQRI